MIRWVEAYAPTVTLKSAGARSYIARRSLAVLPVRRPRSLPTAALYREHGQGSALALYRRPRSLPTAALYVSQLLSACFPASSMPRLSSMSTSSLALRAVRGGSDSVGDDIPPAQVDINRDAETLFSGANSVPWKGGDSELKIGDWNAYKIDDNEQDDWVADLELEGALAFDPPMPDELRLSHKPRVLVLYGSLRPESYSRKLAFECARILERLGCDVRVFHAQGLPLRDPEIDEHPKVQELRQLSEWSEGHVWVSPEMHGEVTGAFKTQIDWLPLNTGSVRPTQGRTVMIAQVCGGSQSFNVVNTLRKLARWMRMPCVTNQSSVPKAWQEFDEKGRMKPSPLRDRVVDVCEEFYKFTLLMRPYAEMLVDRYSERKEKREKGRLLTQAEKEAQKAASHAQTT